MQGAVECPAHGPPQHRNSAPPDGPRAPAAAPGPEHPRPGGQARPQAAVAGWAGVAAHLVEHVRLVDICLVRKQDLDNLDVAAVAPARHAATFRRQRRPPRRRTARDCRRNRGRAGGQGGRGWCGAHAKCRAVRSLLKRWCTSAPFCRWCWSRSIWPSRAAV